MNVRNIYHLRNGLSLLAMSAYAVHMINKWMYLLPLRPFVYILIMLVIAQLLSLWIRRIDGEVTNPLMVVKSAMITYYIGFGLFAVAIFFKILHWPFTGILLLGAIVFEVIAFILSIALDEQTPLSNSDIIDDTRYDE